MKVPSEHTLALQLLVPKVHFPSLPIYKLHYVLSPVYVLHDYKVVTHPAPFVMQVDK